MHMFDPLCVCQVIYRALTWQLTMRWYFTATYWPKGIGLGDSTVFSWAGCHSWYQSDYMHQSFINSLNHWLWIKLTKIVWIYKIHWSVKNELDREALDGFLGSFRWLTNLWFIFLTLSTFLFLSELTFCTTILVHHVLPYVVVPQESPVRDGWDLF
jgi:hypothetical protein